MEITREDSLSFKLTNTQDFPTLNIFLSVIDKVSKEAAKKGFRNQYTKEEKFFLENFVRELKNEVNDSNG